MLIAAGVWAGALLASAGTAGAAVTIGSDLAPDPPDSACAVDCTITNSTLPGSQLTSPVQGVVVRWRVRAGASGGSVDLRLSVIRPGPGGVYSGISKSAVQPFSDVTVTTRTYPTQQAIAPGDQIALDVSGGAVPLGNFLVLTDPVADPMPGTTFVRWQPPLANAETRVPDLTATDGSEVLVNADVEPDCDSDGFGDETQDADVSSCNPPAGDTNPPDTTITKRPKDKTKKKTATFEFSSSESGATFECGLDGGAFAPCTSPDTLKVKKGKHSFEVRARDAAGNVDGSPATDSWKVKKKKRK